MMFTMPINRLNKAAIAGVVGEEAAKRLTRKITGGQSGQKGIRYESFFGAHRVARLIRKLVEHHQDAAVEWQSDGFIDDFVVRRDYADSFKAYQLKNSPTVTWDDEIEGDFRHQHAVASAEGYSDIRLRLVCSDSARAAELANNVPGHLAPFARAFHFPWNPALLRLVMDNTWLAEDFGYLSRHLNPSAFQTSQVVAVMMGAWDTTAPSATVSEVMAKARTTSPTLIRPLQSDQEANTKLTKEFKEALDGVPDFSYRVERGFFHWSAFQGTTSGTYSHDCFSPQFASLQSHIVLMKPTSAEQIEGVLV